EELGWARVPPGNRLSTYQIPEYQQASEAFGQVTLESLENADTQHPTVQPVPYTGVQFLAIPEFQDLGTRVSQQISAAIAGQKSGQGRAGEAAEVRTVGRQEVSGKAMTAIAPGASEHLTQSEPTGSPASNTPNSRGCHGPKGGDGAGRCCRR